MGDDRDLLTRGEEVIWLEEFAAGCKLRAFQDSGGRKRGFKTMFWPGRIVTRDGKDKTKRNKSPNSCVVRGNSMTVDLTIFFYTLVSFQGFVQANFEIEC